MKGFLKRRIMDINMCETRGLGYDDTKGTTATT